MKTETNITTRWDEGVPHHPRSIKLYELIAGVDFKFNGDAHCFKSGGDGDNGESLMYLMDVIFDAEDNNELEQLERRLR